MLRVRPAVALGLGSDGKLALCVWKCSTEHPTGWARDTQNKAEQAALGTDLGLPCSYGTCSFPVLSAAFQDYIWNWQKVSVLLT